jgi:hypothetical protein
MPPRLAPRRLSFSDNSPLANLAAGIRAFGTQHNFYASLRATLTNFTGACDVS